MSARTLPILITICGSLVLALGSSANSDLAPAAGHRTAAPAKPAPATPTENNWARSERYALRTDHKPNREGGSGTAKNVKMALDWLLRHQCEDGSWSSAKPLAQCRKPDSPCENEDPWHKATGAGFEGFDVGVTGLALLAFTGRGNTHIEAEKSEYKEAIAKAIDWLLSQQSDAKEDAIRGTIGRAKVDEWSYNHSIATLALAEALLGSGDVAKLGGPVQEAVEYCLRSQNPGFGWQYGYASGVNDTSSTVWMAMAILAGQSCARAGLIELEEKRVEESLQSAEKWILLVSSKASGKVGYQAPGDPGSQLIGAYGTKYPFDKQRVHSNTAAALSFAMLRGRRGKPPTDLWETLISANPPDWTPVRGKSLSPINQYYWYYGALAMHQVGGKPWKAFNKELKSALRNSQRTRGCEKGSWDPIGEWGAVGGRVYSTALGALALETYYRLAREPEPESTEEK